MLGFARLDQRDQDGNAALNLAARGGHLDVVNSLLEAMANTYAPHLDGLETAGLAGVWPAFELIWDEK